MAIDRAASIRVPFFYDRKELRDGYRLRAQRTEILNWVTIERGLRSAKQSDIHVLCVEKNSTPRNDVRAAREERVRRRKQKRSFSNVWRRMSDFDR